jgi:hypothetical protein
MTVVIALMTTVKIVVIVATVLAANEPDRSWCGWGSCRNHCTVSNKQSELSCASGDANNEDTAAYTTTVTQQKISNSPYIVYGHNYIFSTIITVCYLSNTNKYTELSRNTHLIINASFFYIFTYSTDVFFSVMCKKH